MNDAGPLRRGSETLGMIAKTFGPVVLLLPLIAARGGCAIGPSNQQAASAGIARDDAVGVNGDYDHAVAAFNEAIRVVRINRSRWAMNSRHVPARWVVDSQADMELRRAIGFTTRICRDKSRSLRHALES